MGGLEEPEIVTESKDTKSLPLSHSHSYDKLLETVVPLRRVVIEDGKTIRDIMTGKDTLKQRKCSCGAIETYDLERKVA